MYDFLITTSTYYSVDKSLNLAKSLQYLPGRNLIIFTACRHEDADELVKELKKTDIEYAVFFSEVNNSRFCINWGFICSVMMGLEAKWYISCDDDIEFYEEAKDIPRRLERMKEKGFSIAAFCNTVQQYGGKAACDSEGFQSGLYWLDGNAMFFDYQDVLKYGLTDSLIDQPITFYVEAELCQRYKVLTGKPLMVDLSKVYYKHRYRDDPKMAKARSWNDGMGMWAGSQLWVRKYGIEPGDWNAPDVHQRLWNHVSNVDQRPNMTRHIMYNNLWTTNWPAIERFAGDKVKLVHETIKWDTLYPNTAAVKE